MVPVTHTTHRRRATRGANPPASSTAHAPFQASTIGPTSALAAVAPKPSKPQIRNVVVTARLVQAEQEQCTAVHERADSSSSGTAAASATTTTKTHSGVNLPLHEMAQTMRNAEYNPKRFAALIARMREPSSTALIFRTGKIVCTGNKTVADARRACARHVKAVATVVAALNRRQGGDGSSGSTCFSRNGGIRQRGSIRGSSATTTNTTTATINVKPADIAVQNVVATVDVPWSLELQALATHPDHRQRVSFEPEIFGGLIYRMRTPKVSFLIFMNGKCVLVGAKSPRDVDEAFGKLVAILTERRFRRDCGPGV